MSFAEHNPDPITRAMTETPRSRGNNPSSANVIITMEVEPVMTRTWPPTFVMIINKPMPSRTAAINDPLDDVKKPDNETSLQ